MLRALVNKFELLQKLADGTAAEVFLARSGHDRVLVELSRPALSNDVEMYGRFLDLTRECQKFDHPSLLKLTTTGCQSDGRLYVVTEPIDGPHLGARLAQGPLPLAEAVRLTMSLCDALEYLHARGVVHGNLRPSNVFLTGPAGAPVPKLLDMGLLLFRTTRSLPTPTSVVLVAPEYLSPERVAGQRASPLSDIYGLGVLLFELVVGHAPFVGSSLHDTKRLHISASMPVLPPGLEPVAPIIAKCLSKTPAERYPSMAVLKQALWLAVDDAPSPASAFESVRSTPQLNVHPLMPDPRSTRVERVPVAEPDATPIAQGTMLEQGGQVLGNYELLQRVGQGGMGEVYLARHIKLDRRVAIKVLRKEFAKVDTYVNRFFQEARAVNRVNHPHIVEIHDFVDERERGQVWCVMEYLQGPSLRELARREPFGVARMVRVARQVAQALGAAHRVGVVHRDVKPENILLLDRPGQPDFVKVLDFGIAKLREEGAATRQSETGEGEMIGTPAYMSPEQARGFEVDQRSDIFSLGTVMYVLLAGRFPFDGSTPLQVVTNLVTQPARALGPLTASGEPIDSRVSDLVMRCLSKSADERFASMEALDAALAEVEASGPLEVELGDEDLAEPDPEPSETPPAAKPVDLGPFVSDSELAAAAKALHIVGEPPASRFPSVDNARYLAAATRPSRWLTWAVPLGLLLLLALSVAERWVEKPAPVSPKVNAVTPAVEPKPVLAAPAAVKAPRGEAAPAVAPAPVPVVEQPKKRAPKLRQRN